MKKTVVIGASTNPERYSFKAVESLLNHGHPVVPVGTKKGEIFGLHIENGFPDIDDVDTVSLYVGPANQSEIIPYVLKLKPKRVIFNPGTENDVFETLLENNNIIAEGHAPLCFYLQGCTKSGETIFCFLQKDHSEKKDHPVLDWRIEDL
jgi:predicted CoA-binding protein